jgi:hypothetical protein
MRYNDYHHLRGKAMSMSSDPRLEGARVVPLRNGDSLIVYKGADVPALCVQRNGVVRRAIERIPVTDPTLIAAARAYVQQHPPRLSS